MITGGGWVLARRLVDEFSFLAGYLDENGAELPYTFFWALGAVLAGQDETVTVDAPARILARIDDALATGDDDIVELVHSMFETHREGEFLPGLKPMMGPALLRIYPMYRAD
ncbi:hypothetical protein [Caulobacter sp. FWC2]|uniref:hypothetical protein n=1 Tax=Caulobacter sp. FWC2 TaxID=69664 RepID=UPI000C15D288|nr:hypothetical protein [Caulobacter sp. FWC2]PIB93372.1 hypothetical protein CSW62_18370 [Caulobacter sp. FWC2]